MRYLIDGYNLLHAMGLLGGKVGPRGLEKARQSLLGRLLDNHEPDAASVTVVFDAARSPRGTTPEEDYQGIHVCFAVNGSADDAIEDRIQREATPRQLTVVSDDRRLQQAARRRRCLVLGCMEYLDHVERLRQQKTPKPEASAKPERVSTDETRHWLREFADLEHDPKLREALGPDFREEPHRT
jgi:predicted RNA-binding protein with PIN domain